MKYTKIQNVDDFQANYEYYLEGFEGGWRVRIFMLFPPEDRIKVYIDYNEDYRHSLWCRNITHAKDRAAKLINEARERNLRR